MHACAHTHTHTHMPILKAIFPVILSYSIGSREFASPCIRDVYVLWQQTAADSYYDGVLQVKERMREMLDHFLL